MKIFRFPIGQIFTNIYDDNYLLFVLPKTHTRNLCTLPTPRASKQVRQISLVVVSRKAGDLLDRHSSRSFGIHYFPFTDWLFVVSQSGLACFTYFELYIIGALSSLFFVVFNTTIVSCCAVRRGVGLVLIIFSEF